MSYVTFPNEHLYLEPLLKYISYRNQSKKETGLILFYIKYSNKNSSSIKTDNLICKPLQKKVLNSIFLTKGVCLFVCLTRM